MKKYAKEIEKKIEKFHKTLPEKAKRLYAAIEAEKIGHGGNSYIANLVKCNRKTIEIGKKDLNHIEDLPEDRNRKEGGGRKRCINIIEGIDEVFLSVLKEHTAGDPDNENIKWTNLTRKEIYKGMKEKGISVSFPVVKQLLNKYDYVKRKALKKNSERSRKQE
jgi:hypothetical protein